MAKTREQLEAFANRFIGLENEPDCLKADCDIIEYFLDNCEITVPKENRFFININCCGIMEQLIWKRAEKFHKFQDEFKDALDAAAFSGMLDISHTNTEWDFIISSGIAGLRDRIVKYSRLNRNDTKKERFYSNILRVYNAALRFIKRAAEEALKADKKEMSLGLFNLCENPPKTLFEAMQTTFIYYNLQQFFDSTILRTLGRLDSLYYPFYKNEDKSFADNLIFDFLKEIDRLNAPSNIPFALGGTDLSGKTLINELSYVFLESYRQAKTNNTKLHLLCSDDTPTDILRSAFDGVRCGDNSICFMSDKRIIESLEKMGEEHADAVDYHVVGCYECGGNGELTCSCNARLNIPKALEVTLNKGYDMNTGKLIGLPHDTAFSSFDEFYEEFSRQIHYFCECAMKLTNAYEEHYKDFHSSPFLSGTYTSALEQGGDLYCDYTAKYNNSSLNAIGLATAVDSLVSIKKLVFEEKLLSLNELCKILKSNWENNEDLRLTVKNKFPKFGTGNDEADTIARKTVDMIYDAVGGKANSKGGIYRLGLFSIDWRHWLGSKVAASADGRFCGETLSQNTSATFGADTQGITGHLISVAKIDTTKTPNGTIVDIDLHSSATKGEEGLNALIATLKTYFDLGGFAVHYNVLDTKVLKEAKLDPEKYPNLQVRLCGWNTLFAHLSEEEKNEFIARAEQKSNA